MPELPEVETVKEGIKPHILNKSISNVIIRQPKLRWPVPKMLKSILPKAHITSVTRRAKYLIIETDRGTLIIHLGMSGHIKILSESQKPQKHDHVDFIFNDHTIMRYHDPRRFGAILWTQAPIVDHPRLNHLGIEPLEKAFNGRWLFKQTQQSNKPIKIFLMDAAIVVGIGNIYASEALFMANIHPKTIAHELNEAQCKALVKAIKAVLRAAIKVGGSTLKDFATATGKTGYFQHDFKVYGRDGKPCVTCHCPIIKVNQGGRSTFCCSQCQPLIP